MEELVKEPKLWGLSSLTKSIDVLKSAGHASIIPRPANFFFEKERR
jgi:hypothetical protein